MLRKFFILPLLFFIISCAPNVKMIDEHGKRLPDSYYVLNTINGLKLTITYVNYDEHKDLDKTILYDPVFLKVHTEQTIKANTKFEAIVQVYNPQLKKYNILERFILEDSTNKYDFYQHSALSQAEFRQFNLRLPTGSNVEKCNHEILIYDDKGEQVFFFGPMKYVVKEGGGLSGKSELY